MERKNGGINYMTMIGVKSVQKRIHLIRNGHAEKERNKLENR